MNTCTEYDPKHGVVHYYYSTEFSQTTCPYCKAGTCIQKVESSPKWDCNVIVHMQKKELS